MQYLNSYKTSCCARQHDFRRAPWCAPACPHTGCTHSTIPHKNRARRAVRSQATLADVTAQLQPTNQDATPAQQAAAQQLPRTFRRLVARECGRSFREVAQVVEVELVPPGPGEVLVRVTYAGVNGGCETFRARGEYAFAANRGLKGFPLGAEAVGVVAAVGTGVGGLSVGQAVAVNGAGGFAEYVTARAALVTPVGEGEAAAGPEAAALILSGVTACVALEATARVQPGEVVAVTAAAGGTGHLAVQLAAAAGAHVVAVVSGPAKARLVSELGAATIIDYSQEPDVAAALLRRHPGGADVVYEGVGGALREQLLSCLAPEGRLLQVGYISEYPHTTEGEQGSSGSSGGDSSSDSANPTGCRTGTKTATRAEGRERSRDGDDSSKGDGAAVSGAGEVPPSHSEEVPPCADLFWRGINVERGRQRIIGQIWPKDLKSIVRCRRRVFELHRQGRLRVVTDQGHGRQGVEGVADAVDYMLRGGHLGKVVIRIS